LNIIKVRISFFFHNWRISRNYNGLSCQEYLQGGTSFITISDFGLRRRTVAPGMELRATRSIESARRFYKVTAGAANVQLPLNAATFADGSSGPGGVNSSSPATATVTQTSIPTALNLLTVH
jgi:hypothetical protein